MPNLLHKILEPFCDNDGHLSSMRLMAFITVIGGLYFFYTVLTVWRTICLAKTEFIPLSVGDYAGVIGSIAALFAKGMQKHIEVHGDDNKQFTFDSTVSEGTAPDTGQVTSQSTESTSSSGVAASPITATHRIPKVR